MNAHGERRSGAVCNRNAEFVGTDALLEGGFFWHLKAALAHPLEGNFRKRFGAGFEDEAASLGVDGDRFEGDEDFFGLAFCKCEVGWTSEAPRRADF